MATHAESPVPIRRPGNNRAGNIGVRKCSNCRKLKAKCEFPADHPETVCARCQRTSKHCGPKWLAKMERGEQGTGVQTDPPTKVSINDSLLSAVFDMVTDAQRDEIARKLEQELAEYRRANPKFAEATQPNRDVEMTTAGGDQYDLDEFFLNTLNTAPVWNPYPRDTGPPQVPLNPEPLDARCIPAPMGLEDPFIPNQGHFQAGPGPVGFPDNGPSNFNDYLMPQPPTHQPQLPARGGPVLPHNPVLELPRPQVPYPMHDPPNQDPNPDPTFWAHNRRFRQ